MYMCSLFSHSRALTYCMQNPQAVPPSLTSATILTFFFYVPEIEISEYMCLL